MVASTVNGHVFKSGEIPNGDVNKQSMNGTTNHANGGVGRVKVSRNIRARELMKRNGSLWKTMTFKQLIGLILITTAVIFYYIPLTPYLFPVVFVLLTIPFLSGYLGLRNFIYTLTTYSGRVSKIDEYIEFLDDDAKKEYSGKFIPIRDLYEMYADQKLNFKRDVLECMERRNEFVSYKFQMWHLKFFFQKFIPEMFIHNKKQDREQVCDHYNRGNDFYRSFLGPLMVYTSGLQYNDDDTLEDMQYNKLREVCNKIALQENEKHLDIGCGWGTMVNYAAEHFGSRSTGVTIAKEQIDWASGVTKEKQLEEKANFLCMDYRDIPDEKYDKITCLEMSEHVGIKLYANFLEQVYDMLEDDGIFYLQIAGLRRAWQWEDFMWAFFMDTYIFPGADASLPLSFPVIMLENAGFEVQMVETVGCHYSETIHRWYNNWQKDEHKKRMVEKYGERLYRIWEIFLSWSTIIARQGNSTCYQIVAHKNMDAYPRKDFFKIRAKYNN